MKKMMFSALALSLAAIFATAIERYEYDQVDLRNRSAAPSAEHWFGTDRVGRDVWSRTVHGARVSLVVGLGATAIATVIGTVVGAFSGYFGGWVDMLLMRLTDVVMTFPSIVIMLTLAALLPRNVWSILLIIGGLSWPPVARLRIARATTRPAASKPSPSPPPTPPRRTASATSPNSSTPTARPARPRTRG